LRDRYETLRPPHFQHGDRILRDGISDIAWFDQHGQAMTPEAWGEPEARTLQMRRAALLPDGAVEVMLVLLNADCAPQEFTPPSPKMTWTMLLDTSLPDAPAAPFDDERTTVAAHAVMLLTARVA
jgi:glycogen operon protein